MKGLQVLKLTDVQENIKECEEISSKQFNLFLEEEGVGHISDTIFFITDGNTIVDIQDDISEEDFRKSIEVGAELKFMFFVEDNDFENHKNMEVFQGFNYEHVGDGDEHGVLFDTVEEAEEYERRLERLKEIEEALPEDEIMSIIDNLDMKEIVEELYGNHFYASQGVALYIDLRDGDVFRDTDKAYYTSSHICELTGISLMTDLAETYVMGISEGTTKVVRDEEERQEYLMNKDNEIEFERVITEAEEEEEILESMLEELTIDITEIEEFYKI